MANTRFNDTYLRVYYTGRDGEQYTAYYSPEQKRWRYKGVEAFSTDKETPKDYVTPDGYNFNGDYTNVRNQKNGVNQSRTNQNKTSVAPATTLFRNFYETPDKDGWITNRKGNRYRVVGTTNVFENGEVWDRATGKFLRRIPLTSAKASKSATSGQGANAGKIKVSGVSNSVSPSITYSQRMRRSGFNGDVKDFLNFAISLGYRLRGRNNGRDGLFGEDTEKAWKELKDLYNLYKVKNNVEFNLGLEALNNTEEIPIPQNDSYQPTDIASDYSSQFPLLYGKQTLNYKLKQGGTMQNKDKETQEFVAWLKNKYPDITLEKVSQMQKDGSLEKEYKEFQKSKVKKAEHGIKLNYFKSLKNQCDDDEELIYYKRGGTVDCGCVKKKMEDGGKTPKSSNAISNFKNRKLDLATKDSIAANRDNDQEVQTNRPGSYKKNKDGKVQWTPDRTKAPYKKACGGSMKKEKIKVSCGGTKFVLKGAKVCPKCGKVHTGPCKMSCGSKIKKHLNGGSFNLGLENTNKVLDYINKAKAVSDSLKNSLLKQKQKYTDELWNYLNNNLQKFDEERRKRIDYDQLLKSRRNQMILDNPELVNKLDSVLNVYTNKN